MEQGNESKSGPGVHAKVEAKSGEVGSSKGSLFSWGSVGVGVLSAISGIVGSPFGIWFTAALAVLGLIGFFIGKAAYDNWSYENDKKQAGAKAGIDAATGQAKLNENRDQVDDFLGRDHRS